MPGNLRCNGAPHPKSGILSAGLSFLRQQLPQQPAQLVQPWKLLRQEHVSQNLEAFRLEHLSCCLWHQRWHSHAEWLCDNWIAP